MMKNLVKLSAIAAFLLFGQSAFAGLLQFDINGGNSDCSGEYSDADVECSIYELDGPYDTQQKQDVWVQVGDAVSEIIGKNDGGFELSNYNGYDIWGDITYEACTDGTHTDCTPVLDPTGNEHGHWTYNGTDPSPIRFWINKTGTTGFTVYFYSNSSDDEICNDPNTFACLNTAISTSSGSWSNSQAMSHLSFYNGVTNGIPEPGTLALLGLGLLGMGAARRRKVA